MFTQKKRAAFWVLEDELFVNMGDFQGRTVTRTLGEGYRGPNSHWLVDEQRGLKLPPLTTGK